MRRTSFVLPLAAAMLVMAAGTSDVRAASAYDGSWSASISTERGDCGTVSVGIIIQNGALRYAGDSSVIVRGNVSRNGAVRVSVASGNRSASGAGRLSRSAGRGTWRGFGSSGNSCTGYWSAVRL
jgi:hypothetical protein